jgi:hypothetical protein
MEVNIGILKSLLGTLGCFGVGSFGYFLGVQDSVCKSEAEAWVSWEWKTRRVKTPVR